MSVHDSCADLYREVVEPGLRMLATCRVRGWLVDRPYLRTLLERDRQRLNEIDEELRGLLGDIDNFNSDHQVSAGMRRAGLDTGAYRSDNPEVMLLNKHVLAPLVDQHPAPGLLIERGHLTTMVGTFYEPLLAFSARDGLVHPGYNWGGRTVKGEAGGTETARWSSGKPGVNLMNPPKELRKAFISRYGLIVGPDFSQLEYRIAFAVANEVPLIEKVKQGLDPHTATAELLGIPRKEAKNWNYGALYGAGLKKLIAMGADPNTAALMRAKVLDGTPKVQQWIASKRLEAVTTGWVKGLFAQRFYLPDAQLPETTSENRKMRSHALRNAVNSPIQNAGGLMTMWCMPQIEAEFRKRGMNAIVTGQLHDFISTECTPDEEQEVVEIMNDVMTVRCAELCQPWLRDMPIAVDFTIGPNMYGSEDA